MALTPEEVFYIHKQYADQFAGLTQSGLGSAFNALAYGGLYGYSPAKIDITFPDVGEPKDKEPGEPSPKPMKEPVEIGDKKYDLVRSEKFEPIPTLKVGAAATGGSGITGVLVASSSVSMGGASGTSVGIGGRPTRWMGNPPEWVEPLPKPSINAPEKKIVAPTVNLQVTSPHGAFTSNGGIITGRIALPDEPTYMPYPNLVLPYPTLRLPTKPPITTPVFEGVRPATLTPIDGEALVAKYTTEQQDHRTMLPAFAQETAVAFIDAFAPEYNDIRIKINKIIANYEGGTGVPANIEGAIMARANDRASQEFTKAVNTAAENISKRGFTLPPGALQAVLTQSRMMMGDAIVRSSTEVATKNLELEQQNFQFMLKLGEALEEKILDVTTQYLALSIKMDEQSIASAKELVAINIGAYNLMVLVYKAMLDGYQTDAEVLKARIAANESLVKLFGEEIKAELAKNEINTSTVALFKAMVDINAGFSAEYKAKLEAALAPVEIMKLQLGMFESQIRGYTAEVGAYEAQWRAYASRLESSMTPLKVYEEKVRVFGQEVAAFKAEIDGYSAQAQAAADTNKAYAQHNAAMIESYGSEISYPMKVKDHEMAVWTTTEAKLLKDAELEIEYWRTKANMIFTEYNANLNQTFEFAREQMHLFLGRMQAGVTANQGLVQAAQVAGNLAGSAMQGLSSFAGNIVSSQS